MIYKKKLSNEFSPVIEILRGRVLNLIFHLHAGGWEHFGRHLKIFESQYSPGGQMEFLAVAEKQ